VYIYDERFDIDERIAFLVQTISAYQRTSGAIALHSSQRNEDNSSTYHNSYLAYQALLSLQNSDYTAFDQTDKVSLMTEEIACSCPIAREL
jgi:hypothetical protein